MRFRAFLLGFAFAALVTSHTRPGTAYELITHAQISQHAFDVSTGVATYLDDVGISPTAVFDGAAAALSTKFADFDNTGTPRDWLAAGAIREDDFKTDALASLFRCPQPLNPPSDISRVLNHFFDVQRGGRGLTVGTVQGIPAPDWALPKEPGGPNKFSFRDARVYQFKSVTEPQETDREKNAALLFRALGQVIHLVQDMAQPQHTRNDPHAGCERFPANYLAGEHSWYEEYIDMRAQGRTFGNRQTLPLTFGDYAPPRFTTPRDFWGNDAQTGLADFSSRNFLSAGTNLPAGCAGQPDDPAQGIPGAPGLPQPPCDPASPEYQRVETPFSLTSVDGQTVSGVVTLFKRTAQDRLTGAAVGPVAVTSQSLWDQFLEAEGRQLSFSMNTLVYDEIIQPLLPRAVGYSAGLLDHFFRGRLAMEAEPALLGDRGGARTVLIRNLSAEPMRGTITFYYDDDLDGERKPAGGPITVDIPPGGQVGGHGDPEYFRFQVPVVQTGPYLAVFQGDLGEERESALAAARVTLVRPRVGSMCVAPGCSSYGPSSVQPGETVTATALDARGANSGFWIMAGNDANGECPLGTDCA